MPIAARTISTPQSSTSQDTVLAVQYCPHQLLQPNDIPRSCTACPAWSTIRLPDTESLPCMATGVPPPPAAASPGVLMSLGTTASVPGRPPSVATVESRPDEEP